MSIKAGERMPSGTLKTMTKDGPRDVATDELFKGKKVVLFSVPGAFTPTCDAKHLPGFVQLADQLRAKGVDTIAYMAVNDPCIIQPFEERCVKLVISACDLVSPIEVFMLRPFISG